MKTVTKIGNVSIAKIDAEIHVGLIFGLGFIVHNNYSDLCIDVMLPFCGISLQIMKGGDK